MHSLIPLAFDEDLGEVPQILQYPSRSTNDCGQRILGDVHRKICLEPNALIKPLEKCTATGKHNTAIKDIC